MILLELLVGLSLTLSLWMLIYVLLGMRSQNQRLRRAQQIEAQRYDALLKRLRRLEARAQSPGSQGGAAR